MKKTPTRRHPADEGGGWDKRVLAGLYYPNNTEVRAVARLRQDIVRCAALHEALRRMGYRPKQHTFTPAQTALLYEYLGEP